MRSNDEKIASIDDCIQNSLAVVGGVGIEVSLTFGQSFNRFAFVGCYGNSYRIESSVVPRYYAILSLFLFVKT